MCSLMAAGLALSGGASRCAAREPLHGALASTTSGGGITLVQHASLDANMSTSASLSFKSPNTAGNWIGVAVRGGAMNEVFSIHDSRGNVYRKAFQLNQTGHAECLALFYAENISGGANTITVSDSIFQTLRFSILEYSGVATSSSLDASASAQGSGTAPSSGATTTTANGDLLLGVVMTGDADSFAAGSGYTLEESVPAEPAAKLITEDQIQTIAGTAAASVSLTGTQPWAAGVAAFKPAGTVASSGRIALVQHASLDANMSTSASLSFKSANTAGNWIGVAIRGGAMNEVFSIHDSRGNVYRKAFQLNQTGHAECLALFYAENISGGANTITVSDSIFQTLRFSILEYSGVAASSSLDASASAQGSGTAPSSGATTTTANGDLLLGVVMTGDADSFSAGSGYTLEESVPAEPAAKLITEGQIQQSAGSATASVSLTGTQPWAAGIAAFKPAGSASVDATPGSAQFGNVPVGTNNTQAIQITNGGSASVSISNVSSTGSQFAVSGLTAPLTLAAGGSAMFTVGFAPTSTGTFSGSVALQMNGSSSSLLIPLLGTGIAVTQALTVNPTNVSFGNVPIGQSATINVAVQNTGNSSVLVGSVGVGGTGFSVAGLSGGTTIGAGQSATLQAEFVPKSTGNASGTITILSNAANDPSLSLPIAGTGISSQTRAVDLSWVPSTSTGVVGYNVYRSSVSGSGYVKLAGSPVGATTLAFTDNGVTSGSSYYYVVTSLSGGGEESAYSAQTSVAVP